MKTGEKIVCVDDQGWLIPNHPGPNPVKGGVYQIRELIYVGSCLAVSLEDFHPDDFFRASRFVPLQTTPARHVAIKQQTKP